MTIPPSRIRKYEILGELGRGAMGTVFKARDTVLERVVALKTMSEALLVEEQALERFYREARAAANLKHPNIVTIHDMDVDDDGTPFIAMELLDGRSLADILDAREPLRLDDKLRLIIQVCRGLDHAHKQGVIHRDVKPGNIQVLPDGTVKLLDFGIALREGSTVKTKTGLVMGTPNYMAPEQIAGAPVDHRADMWAVGVILYELLSGRRPFEAQTIPSLIYRIVHEPLAEIDARKLGLPHGLADIVHRSLQKDPNARFRDLTEMASRLQAVLGVPLSEAVMPPELRESGYLRNLELARTFLARGQPARALESARRAQALEPSRPEVGALVREIEAELAAVAESPTVATRPAGGPPAGAGNHLDKWIDEARLALTAGKRTEALRIVEDVLTLDPAFPAAVELRDILDTPAAPGRVRTGQHRSFGSSGVGLAPPWSFRDAGTFGESLGIQAIAISPQERLLAVGGSDGSIRLWDLRTQSKLTTLRSDMHRRAGHEGLVTSLTFSVDGALLASGHVDGAIHVWDLNAGEELRVRLGHDASVGAIAFSPDGGVLASGGLDANLKLWEVATLRAGEARRRLLRQPSGVSSLVYALGGAVVVTGHVNRILRVMDARSGRLTATLRGHEAAVSFLTTSADGECLASGSQDRTLRVFHLKRRVCLTVLEGHKRTVSSAAFFPDGRHLASVAMENNLIIWDLAGGKPQATLWGDTGESFVSVQVYATGRRLACARADGRIRLWAAP